MVVTGGSPDPEGQGKSQDPHRDTLSPEVPKENNYSQARFNFDPAETVIVVRRKKDASGRENSVVLKSLLKQTSLLTNNSTKGGRIEKLRVVKRFVHFHSCLCIN